MPKCKDCKILEGRDMWWRCTNGKFDTEDKYQEGRMIPRWFRWSGIIKPNKAVDKAQKECNGFEPN